MSTWLVKQAKLFHISAWRLGTQHDQSWATLLPE